MERIPIVNIILEKEGKVVMLRRAFYPENKLDLLGGYVDKGESIEQAAIREAKEESGFDVVIKEKMGTYPYEDRGNKIMHVFLGEILEGSLTASKEGSPEWVDLSKVKKEELAFPQVHVTILDDFLKSRNARRVS